MMFSNRDRASRNGADFDADSDDAVGGAIDDVGARFDAIGEAQDTDFFDNEKGIEAEEEDEKEVDF